MRAECPGWGGGWWPGLNADNVWVESSCRKSYFILNVQVGAVGELVEAVGAISENQTTARTAGTPQMLAKPVRSTYQPKV
jgi:hypothetical protein